MKQKRTGVLSVLVGLLVIAALFASFGLEAGAQDGESPTPTPDSETPLNRNSPEVFYAGEAVSEGDAEWTLTDRTFTSFYPTGFEFTAVASSSAGEIVNATTVWSHAPRQLRRRPAEYDQEAGVFRTRWEHDEDTPPWAAVNYQWQFTDSEGNTYESEWFLGDEYYDPEGDWQRYESEDIIVFVQDGLPEDTGQQTLDAMAAQRETYRQAWGHLLSNKPRAILFNSTTTFQEWQTGTVDNRIAGLTSSEWGGTAQRLASGGVTDLTWGTVLHEVGHLYQEEFASAFFAPGSWWTEGNASFFELNQQYDYEQRVRRIAANGNLPVLLQGTGPNPSGTGPDGIGRYGYDVGYTFFKWLSLNYGLDAHRQIVESASTSRSRNEILEEVLGIPADQIEREWRLWLGASGDAPTLIPTPTIRFPPTVTPFQFPTSSSDD